MLSPRTCLIAFCGLCLLPLALYSEDPKANDEEGFVSLFNGTDLTGWKISEKGDWKVVDGAIVTPTTGRSHLFTEKEFKNFVFRAEVMTSQGSNSGIYFHTEYEENWPSHGYECQVNTSHTDPVRNGSIYYVVKNYEPVVKDDEWFPVQIEVKGKNVRTTYGGKLVVDFTEPDGLTQPRRINKGSFALQGHDPKSVVKFRNIRVKELP